MGRALVIGVDPGPTTGIVALPYAGVGEEAALGWPMVLQCDHYSVVYFVRALLDGHTAYRRMLAVEQFVVGPRSSRSGTAEAGRITRRLIGALSTIDDCTQMVLRPAGQVKPWATDRRLHAAGLLTPTNGMNHARDAARHALYAAVHAGLAADPMSSTAAR
jgi:hypothetical protein